MHGQALRSELDALLGYVIRQLCAACHTTVAHQVGQVLHPHRHGGGREQDVAAGKGVPPVGDAPALHPCPNAVAGGRALEALGKLLRAAPLHFDGGAHGLGEHGGLQLDRAQRAATKTTADAAGLHLDALCAQVQMAREYIAHVEQVLGACPNTQGGAVAGRRKP
ncbi:hypothetical protein D3C71_1749660 [compost metagenome]